MIVIIGAGLSGLLTAFRLKKEGIPFKILEARNRIGGRINTIFGTENTPVEMGATWFNEHHKHLISLLEELEMNYFEQYMDDTVFFQRTSNSPTEIISIPNQSPSYRISGGTAHLINVLYNKLDKKDVVLNQTVQEIKWQNNTIQVIAEETFEADKVVLSIPPKLWAKKIVFTPSLPENLIKIANQTHTWMEDSIKVALTFGAPFWKEDKISSSLFSNIGPITEFYDHCNEEQSKYALCGFIHNTFKNLTLEERKSNVINQLKHVFGEKIETFIDYEECVWSQEPHTFVAAEELHYPHQNNGNPIFNTSHFNHKLIISSSESALEFPGYMDGAIYAANINAKKIIDSKNYI